MVASLHDIPSNGASKTAFFHINTGATCVVTAHADELHCPIPTNATCGTVAKGPRATINAFGLLVLDFITDKGTTLLIEFPQATKIQQFKRCSLWCHALQDLGYKVQHALLASGNHLKICKVVGQDMWYSVPLVTHGCSDYVKVCLHQPAIE
jgi:hypothetical protein